MASQVQLHWEQGMGMLRGRTTGRLWSCSRAMFPKHYREESPLPCAIYPLGFTLRCGVVTVSYLGHGYLYLGSCRRWWQPLGRDGAQDDQASPLVTGLPAAFILILTAPVRGGLLTSNRGSWGWRRLFPIRPDKEGLGNLSFHPPGATPSLFIS